jgi:glutamate synthase (ferredoxin)
MSGGIAYVLDGSGDFARRCNTAMVDLEPVTDADAAFLRDVILRHARYTKSARAEKALSNWEVCVGRFVKVMPRDYRRVIAAQERAQAEGREPLWEELLGVKNG